jgi:hypothetical protein
LGPRRRRIGLHADGEVLKVNRLPDALGQPLFARVDAAHRALELRELPDHVGRQIRLREAGGLRRFAGDGRAGAEGIAGNPLCKRLDPPRLLKVGSQLLVKQQRSQPFEARLERCLPVGLPEEPRVAQPRGNDALGVPCDRPLVVRLGVDHGQERILQTTVLGFDGKIVLMVDERRGQHFLRQFEELEGEGAGDH